MNMYLIFGLVLFCALLGGIGQIFFKLGSSSFSLDVSLFQNWQLIVGVVLYGVAMVLFIYALKFGNVSILYPLIATSYIWVSLFASVFLGEAFPLYKWSGVLLIIGGIAIITH